MRRLLQIAVLAVTLLSGVAHAGEPLVRVRVLTPGPFAVGQAISVDIQVLAPNYFLSAVEFPALTIPGAIIAPRADRPVNFTETIGGETYAGIHQVYSIVPQQGGAFTLPPAAIAFAYAAVPGQTAQASLTLPPERIDVAGAAGATQAAGPAYTLTQTFDRDLTGLKAGDAVNRTVTVTGRDMPAMTIQPPRIVAPDGVKLYRHDPELADGGAAGGGRRIERLTYEFPRAGDYVLPAISEGAATLPEVRIHIAAAASAKGAIAPAAPSFASRLAEFAWGYWLPRAAAIAAGLLLLIVIWLRYGLHSVAAIKAWRVRRADSEAAYFGKLTAACRSGDRAAVYRALHAWSSRAGILSVSEWVARFGSPSLTFALEALQRDLFGTENDLREWQSAAFAQGFAAARNRWRKSGRRVIIAGLPALN